MLAKLFNNISIQSLIRALLFSGLVLAGAWFLTGLETKPLPMLAWQWQASEVFQKLLLVGVLLLVPWWLNGRINDIGFLKNDYQLIPVFTLLLAPVLFKFGNPLLILVLPMGIFLVVRLLQLVQTVDPSFILFDAGAVVALMSVLIPESVFLLLVIWLATINFGHFAPRTFLMPLIGVAAICFLLFTVLYWVFTINALDLFLAGLVSLQPVLEPGFFSGWWVFLPVMLLGVPSLLETVQVYGKASVKKRQVFTFLILFFLVSALGGFFMENALYGWVWLLVVLAVFIVNLLHYLRKNWYKNMVYLLLVLFFFLCLLF